MRPGSAPTLAYDSRANLYRKQVTATVAPHIPDVTGLSLVDAAVTYAEAGFYVLPVKASTKHPGSIVGKGWPDKSTRDPGDIRRLFNRRNLAVALHMHTQAVAFDVDTPSKLPDWLHAELSTAPFQATRNEAGRGHYMFDAGGIGYSNSVAGFPAGWGEVRGRNGVIVVQPSVHSKPEGVYRWERTGELPPVPAKLAQRLRVAGLAYGVASAEQVAAFFDQHHAGIDKSVEFADKRVGRFVYRVDNGSSRHEAMLRESMIAMSEAAEGVYPAEMIYDLLVDTYIDAVADRTPSDEAEAEVKRMLDGAISKLTKPVQEAA